MKTVLLYKDKDGKFHQTVISDKQAGVAGDENACLQAIKDLFAASSGIKEIGSIEGVLLKNVVKK